MRPTDCRLNLIIVWLGPWRAITLSGTRGGFGHDPETALVRGIMVKKAYYCSEHQSVDEAREIMREHNLQYLPVVDEDMRVIGMVALGDLAAIEQRQRNRSSGMPGGKRLQEKDSC